MTYGTCLARALLEWPGPACAVELTTSRSGVVDVVALKHKNENEKR